MIKEYTVCFFCDRPATEEHHAFQGAYRKKCEKYGFVFCLCHDCHNEPPYGVHHHKERRNELKRICQMEYEQTHTRAQFIAEFGKSYLEV